MTVIGVLLTIGILIAFVWMIVDCVKVFGAAWAVVVAILGIVFLPAVWLVILIYYVMRNNRLANPPGDPNWQRDLDAALRERQHGAQRQTSGAGATGGAGRDPEIELLAGKGDIAGAIRLAKEKAAQALNERDFAAARLYENYLEKFRRGGK